MQRSTVLVSTFFFQAEDGIRDYKVTGVQTCALPISLPWWLFLWTWLALMVALVFWLGGRWALVLLALPPVALELYHGNVHQIGRASCRERVGMLVGAGWLDEQAEGVWGGSGGRSGLG